MWLSWYISKQILLSDPFEFRNMSMFYQGLHSTWEYFHLNAKAIMFTLCLSPVRRLSTLVQLQWHSSSSIRLKSGHSITQLLHLDILWTTYFKGPYCCMVHAAWSILKHDINKPTGISSEEKYDITLLRCIHLLKLQKSKTKKIDSIIEFWCHNLQNSLHVRHKKGYLNIYLGSKYGSFYNNHI